VHDEISIEYPETMPEMARKLEEFMEESAKIYCPSVPIPAMAEVADCWKH
jgi:DNA polymerase I-like protein with 3'-5' exonuclease and polymerase domains